MWHLTLELCNKKAAENLRTGNVRKLPLEVRKKICGYVLGKPLAKVLSVVA